MTPGADRPSPGARVRDVEFAGAIGQPGQAPPGDLPEIAVAGRSNVGKSSLINAMVGRKRLARVSGTPGRTREVNFFRIDGRFFLVDLPGYGFARAPEAVRATWRSLMETYLQDNARLRGLVVLVDCRRGLQEADRHLLGYVAGGGLPVLFALTKVDKLNRSGRQKAVRDLQAALDLPADQVVATSARTGDGVQALVDALYGLVDDEQGGNT
ncbi:MAG: ribosome biogenesis GTP-binding protein YihA/YsxC [Gemmatimonadota bacterium]|nr:ribosome biogenesis GTP-binding protein YihA/YsxC [Gemmatimonadota bacterium]